VTSGSFVRSIHAYGSSAIIIVLLLHLAQTTFFTAPTKAHRERVWIAGCFLLALMLGMAFTGYLLPWDQRHISRLPWAQTS
jgi:ubiquinol-cytochrome c reductase cytochrome b subunit